MDKTTSHEAALKLINDIALVDTELAAKIKPSIDMFIESLDSTLSNNELFTQLADFFKLTDDNAKKQWLMQHQDLATKINEIFDSMNNQAITLNEMKEVKNGIPTTDIPIQSEVKEEKKEDKKDEEETDEQPVQPKDLKLPEDGFKGEKVTQPLKIEGDDKRFMGRKDSDLPTPEEMDPNKPVKVRDGTEGQAETVNLPDLTKMKTTINLESARKFFNSAFRNSMNKVLIEHKLIKEAVESDKYTEFLDKCQLDWSAEGRATKFIPIRKYATNLYKQFREDFASYEDAMAVAKEWYAFKGKKKRESERIVPSNIYVELRKGKDSNFVVNVYLVKTKELDSKDADLASDLFVNYTDTFVDDQSADKIWMKLPKPLRTANGIASVYMISIPIQKDGKHKVVLSRVKHDIVNMIRSDYKDYYIPTTKIPSWVYSQNESLNEAKNIDYKEVYRTVINEILDNDTVIKDGDFVNDEDVKEYILDELSERLEYYCDRMDIDFVDASSALTSDEINELLDEVVDKFLFDDDDEPEFLESLIREDKEPYNHNDVKYLAREFVEDLLTLNDNPWDMKVKDFILWAWGPDVVPSEEVPYIAKEFNQARSIMYKTESTINKSDYMPDYKVVNIIVQRLWKEYLRRNGLNVINFKDEDALEYINKHFKYDINKYCEEYGIDVSQFDSITDKDIKIVFDKMLELYDL